MSVIIKDDNGYVAREDSDGNIKIISEGKKSIDYTWIIVGFGILIIFIGFINIFK